ncbi:MAG: DNA-binding response regulator [Methylocystaceae bacterium]|nr:MAG: DNA-binding response regulator [Methylocystaceae bacterium]
MRVLMVEDDVVAAQNVELVLKSENFDVHTADLGEKGISLGMLNHYDLILLDLHLPDMSGYEVLRKLRHGGVKTPILILSGSAAVQDKVKALTLGADDYLSKPFHRQELIARIYAIVRRTTGHAESIITIGDLDVKLDHKTAEVNGAQIRLTGKEYHLLEVLALRKGATLSKQTLLAHLYGGIDQPEIKIIDVFICKLRKKLANATGGKHYIETVSGCGYMLNAPSQANKRAA